MLADIADIMRGRKWDEADHPREPEGVPEGGQFAEKITINLGRGFDDPSERGDAMMRDLDALDMSSFNMGWSHKVGAAIATMHVEGANWLPKGWEEGTVVKIDTLNISARGKPWDTFRVLRDITEAADRNRVTLTLNAHPFSTNWVRSEEIELSDLKRLYRRYGFAQPRKGSPNFIDYDTMVRRPRTAAQKALDEALDFMRGEKYDPDQPRDPEGTPTGGQWTDTGAGGGEEPSAEDNNYALGRWLSEKANAGDPRFRASNEEFALAGLQARASLKQEIVEDIAKREGLIDVMPETLPYRLTADPSEYNSRIRLEGGAADAYIDQHDAQAVLRQQGNSINGKHADQQSPVDPALMDELRREGNTVMLSRIADGRMTPREIQQWNARVFADANMDTWHGTSSDGDPRSHALQQAALDEFRLHGTDSGWKDAPTMFGAANPAEFPKRQAQLQKNTKPEQFRSYVRETYAHTQAELAKAGVKGSVTVYRGMAWNTLEEVPEELRGVMTAAHAIDTVAQVKTQSNPLSSWSVSYQVARDFAHSGVYRLTLKATVPVSSIIATARTGPGALTEGEIIVMGGGLEAEAAKVSS